MTEDASTQRGGPGPTWAQRAGFSVLFDLTSGPATQEIWRTRIYHDETGQETVLALADALRWPRWILPGSTPIGSRTVSTPGGLRHPIRPPRSRR